MGVSVEREKDLKIFKYSLEQEWAEKKLTRVSGGEHEHAKGGQLRRGCIVRPSLSKLTWRRVSKRENYAPRLFESLSCWCMHSCKLACTSSSRSKGQLASGPVSYIFVVTAEYYPFFLFISVQFHTTSIFQNNLVSPAVQAPLCCTPH